MELFKEVSHKRKETKLGMGQSKGCIRDKGGVKYGEKTAGI